MGLPERLQETVIKAYGPTDWPIPVFHVMVKPGGPACNMACGYCYYRHNTGTLGLEDGGTISDELLEKFIREYIQSQVNPTVFFVWQGGEPTLMGLEKRDSHLFREALAGVPRSYPGAPGRGPCGRRGPAPRSRTGLRGRRPVAPQPAVTATHRDGDPP